MKFHPNDLYIQKTRCGLVLPYDVMDRGRIVCRYSTRGRCAVRRYCILVSLIHNSEIIFNTVVYIPYDGRLFDYNHYEKLVETTNVNLRWF